MPRILIICLAAVGLSCSISPVVTEPMRGEDSRYRDCRRASRDYCEDVIGAASGEDSRSCVAKHTFECVAGPRS